MHERVTSRAIALTVLGAVIGAGFASGQEVLQFFVKFGADAYAAILVSTVGFVVMAVLLTGISLKFRLSNYQGLLAVLGGRRVAAVFRHIFAFFLWIGLTVMIAGSAALLNDVFGLPKLVVGLGTAAVVYLVIRQKAQGLARANDLLMPCLIFLVLFFLLRSLPFPSVPAAGNLVGRPDWIWSGLLYVAFNSAILFVVIPPLVARTDVPRQAYLGVLGGMLLLCALLSVVVHLLRKFQGLIVTQQIPMLAVSQHLVPSLPFLYAVPLWIALATTAFADAIGLQAYLEEECPPHRAKQLFLLLLLLAIIVAQASFARLVALLYPLMGYICLGFCLFCLVRWLLKALTA